VWPARLRERRANQPAATEEFCPLFDTPGFACLGFLLPL
jgi:hypothetical protein